MHRTRKFVSQNKYFKNNKTRKYSCSPKYIKALNNYTCFTDKNLYKLKDVWNRKNTTRKITASTPKEIHNVLRAGMAKQCKDNEHCWLVQLDQIKDKELISAFSPYFPKEWTKNPTSWLSSDEIINVMKQYEKAYPCFAFIGPSPIDFDSRMNSSGTCVWNALCNFQISKMIKLGKTKIGISLNTDPHNKPGQHWISLFIDNKTKKITYFDSTGDHPPKEVDNFVKRVIRQGKECVPSVKFRYYTTEGVRHQKEDTECGMYSLYFIINMLRGRLDEKKLRKTLISDKYMQKFRRVFFTNPELTQF